MALKRVSIPSPNYSSRDGGAVRLIVVHTAEGARTYQDLGAYFQGDVGVSSHVGIDDTPGTVGEYVQAWNGKAWTAANYNPVAVQAELCAFASWTPADWDDHPNMLETCAAWIAEEASRFDLPITRLNASQAQGSGRGVTGHNELGAGGGGHWDPGPSFPWDRVLDLARSGGDGGAGPAPPSQPSSSAPPYPGYPLVDFTDDPAARTWQARMQERGWIIDVDGLYGPASATVCAAFQAEKGLDADGIVGPITWDATWAAPVT